MVTLLQLRTVRPLFLFLHIIDLAEGATTNAYCIYGPDEYHVL